MLCERHGAGVEPAVDDLGDAVHLAAAVRAGEGHAVDVGTVQLDVVRAILGHGLELRDRADAVALAAGALPDVQRGAPIAVARDAPILDIAEPVAEAALADVLREPVDRVVVGDEAVAHLGHADEPGLARVVDQRGLAAPAVRIVMLELRRGEELALGVEVFQHLGVGVLHEKACIRRFCGHEALGVHELHERQVVVPADTRVVLTEGRRDVDDAGTVAHGNIGIAGDEMRLLALLGSGLTGAREQRLIGDALEVLAGVGLQHLIGGVAEGAEDGVEEGVGHDVDAAVCRLDLVINCLGMDAERDVRGERPGGRRPREEILILAVADLKADDRGAFLDELIALRDLVRGQRRAAVRAIGHDLEALVEEALVVDLLERPPLGLDEVIVVRHIGMLHIRPESDGLGEVLPHALVLPNGLLALLDEGLEAVLLDLLLAVEAERLLDLQLDGEAVGVPAGLTGHEIALHGAVAGDHVLDGARQDVADVGLAVRGGRAVIEDVGPGGGGLFHALLEDVVRDPELLDRLLAGDEAKIAVDLFVHAVRPPFFGKK